MIPLTIYIHLPWCLKKCPYCDFNSHALQKKLPETEYVQALTLDLLKNLPHIQHRSIQSIFFGGGTPSLFSEKSIARILAILDQHCTLAKNLEITLEANPGTLEHRDFTGFRQAGINRISLGVQSFQDTHLSKLGRIHTKTASLQAIQKIKKAQFKSFNLDLMHGLVHQTPESALLDLQIALDQDPDHLSWYQLTLEPNTAFATKPPPLPTDDLIYEMQVQGHALLQAAGLKQYEVSAFSKPHAQCQHNLNYWRFGDYLGIGAGSHSKITDLQNKTILRIAKIKQPTFYLDPSKNFICEKKVIPQTRLPFEFMLNTLRLHCGFECDLFEQRTFLPIQTIQPILNTVLAKKLIQMDHHRLTLTELGTRFLNDVVEAFLE